MAKVKKKLIDLTDFTTADIPDSTDKRYVSEVQKSNIHAAGSDAETTTSIGALINGATAKSLPVDNDMIGLMDSSASNVLKKLSIADLKTTVCGGGAQDVYTAYEDLAEGVAVTLYNDGGTEKIRKAATPGTFQANFLAKQTFTTASITMTETIQMDTNKFVILYTNTSTYRATVVCGTVAGDTITYGTPVELSTTSQAGSGTLGLAYLDTDKFVVVMRDSSNYSGAVVCTISGTTITAGSIQTEYASGSMQYFSACNIGTNKFVMSYYGSTNNYSYVVACTVSGTTITFGTRVSAANSQNYYAKLAKLSTDKFIYATPYNNSGYVVARCGTVSSTTITLGTQATISSARGNAANVLCLVGESATKFVIVSYGADYTVYGWVCTISGTTITVGSESTIIITTNSSYTPQIALINLGVGRCLLYYGVPSISYTTQGYLYLTYTGTTITVNPFTSIFPDTYLFTLPSLVTIDSANNKYMIAANNYQESKGACCLIYAADISNILGVTNAAITAGNTGSIIKSGSIKNNYSGLTLDTNVYVHPGTGLPTQTSMFGKRLQLGFALSASSILVTKNSYTNNIEVDTGRLYENQKDILFINATSYTELPDSAFTLEANSIYSFVFAFSLNHESGADILGSVELYLPSSTNFLGNATAVDMGTNLPITYPSITYTTATANSTYQSGWSYGTGIIKSKSGGKMGLRFMATGVSRFKVPATSSGAGCFYFIKKIGTL